MSKDADEPRFHILQPLRDPESNWSVDVAQYLEDYLVKICSGEVTGDDDGHLSINFAEAALLLQGSVQVYGRKVEYLYSLVLQALEFLSQNRQQNQPEITSDQTEGSASNVVVHDENEPFLELDDIPVDAKNCLDEGSSKDDNSNLFVKPPANLVVLEGDCFDNIGDVGELESYLLATHDLYRDFILLDPCDAGAVDQYLDEDKDCRGNTAAYRGSSLRSKTRKNSFISPTRQPVGNTYRSPLKETLEEESVRTPNNNVGFNDANIWPDVECDLPENNDHEDEIYNAVSEPRDDSDSEDDPWKPLNPHEPGNLKVKPFRKGRNLRKQNTGSTKLLSIASQFPVARLHGIINPEYKDLWEVHLHETERAKKSQSPPLYEKLRQSLDIGVNESFDDFTKPAEDGEEQEDDNGVPDFGNDDFMMPESTFLDAEEPLNHDMHDSDVHFASNEVSEPEGLTSLEDLCRSHLDALLANIAETEKQTELAARVSTWKQKIESTLEEEDSCVPFDIHQYGEKILDKLSMEPEGGSGMSFGDVVSGHEKPDVARSFSALLQLVNNRSVDLVKDETSSEPVCYTAANPFHVKLLTHGKRRDGVKIHSKKRSKSPIINTASKTAKTKSFSVLSRKKDSKA